MVRPALPTWGVVLSTNATSTDLAVCMKRCVHEALIDASPKPQLIIQYSSATSIADAVLKRQQHVHLGAARLPGAGSRDHSAGFRSPSQAT